jgi:hypothetical protein
VSIGSTEHADTTLDASAERAQPRPRPAGDALPALFAASPFLVVAARILWTRGDPVYSGDAGLLALAVRSAAHGSRTLGPYSRFGFFHPGPALFYVLVPFESLTRNARWALPFGVAVLSAIVAAALVVVVQRHAPDANRRIIFGAAAATVILAYALLVDIGLLSILWNPVQIMLPTALLLVAAAYVEGWGWPLGIVAVASTFVVQTHLATAPVAAACVICAIVFLARGSWRNINHAGGALLLAGLAVIAWLPPLWQQATAKHGNLADLVSFFRHSSDPRPGWGRALTYAGRELAVFPARMPWEGDLTPATVHGRSGATAFVAFAGAAVLLIVLAGRRDERHARRLGIVSLAAAFAAVYAVASIRDSVGWYLTAYMTAIVVPLALGWILIALHRAPRPATRVVLAALVVCTAAAVGVASTTSVYNDRAFPNEPRYRVDAEAAWQLLAAHVRDFRGHTVVLGGDSALVPTISGVALDLEEHGVAIRVTDALVPTFGPERRAPTTRRADILVTTDVVAGYEVLGRTTSAMLHLPVVVSIAP